MLSRSPTHPLQWFSCTIFGHNVRHNHPAGWYNPRRRNQIPQAMLAEYAPILIFLVIAGALGVILLLLGMALGRGQKYAEKTVAVRVRVRGFRGHAHAV